MHIHSISSEISQQTEFIVRSFEFFFGSRKNAVPRRARSSDVTTEVGNIAGPRQNHVLEGPDGAVTESTSGRAQWAPWHPLRRLGPLLGTSATPIERGKRYTRRSENRKNAIRPPCGFYNRAEPPPDAADGCPINSNIIYRVAGRNGLRENGLKVRAGGTFTPPCGPGAPAPKSAPNRCEI